MYNDNQIIWISDLYLLLYSTAINEFGVMEHVNNWEFFV